MKEDSIQKEIVHLPAVQVIADEYQLDKRIASGMERGLHEYFMGYGTKEECLDRHGSSATYYSWKKKHPEAVEAIEHEARVAALVETDGDNIAFRASQLRASREVQVDAILKLKKAGIIDALADIALGQVRLVEMGPDEEPKRIIPYPRDQVEATRRLQELARGGVLPESADVTMEFIERMLRKDAAQEEKGQTTLQKLGLGVTPEFTKITAETADGRVYTAEVSDSLVVEGEQSPA